MTAHDGLMAGAGGFRRIGRRPELIRLTLQGDISRPDSMRLCCGVAIRSRFATLAREPNDVNYSGETSSVYGIILPKDPRCRCDVLRQHDDYRPLSFRRPQNILGSISITRFHVAISHNLYGWLG